MAISGDQTKEFVGSSTRKPREGSCLAGKSLIGGGRGIDEFIELNAEVTLLPNESGGRVVGAL
jgi:hypothetical protein